MSFSLVASTSESGPTNQAVTTAPVNTAGATLLVLSVGWYSGSTPTVTPADSKGNTWVPLTKQIQLSTLVANQLFYCAAPTVGSGHTFTVEDLVNNIYPSVALLAYSGAHDVPFDQETGAVTVGNASTLATGSLTPSQDNCLVIAGAGHEANGAGAVSINAGFTALTAAYVSGGGEGCGIASLVQTTAAAAAPTWDTTNNTGIAATLAVFKAAAAAGGSAPFQQFLGHPRGIVKLR